MFSERKFGKGCRKSSVTADFFLYLGLQHCIVVKKIMDGETRSPAHNQRDEQNKIYSIVSPLVAWL